MPGQGVVDEAMRAYYGHLLADERERLLAEARRVARELVVLDAALRPDGAPDGLLAELGGGRVLHSGDWFVMVAALR
jgi:hypothetical protein